MQALDVPANDPLMMRVAQAHEAVRLLRLDVHGLERERPAWQKAMRR
jgi:hypothetical protein